MKTEKMSFDQLISKQIQGLKKKCLPFERIDVYYQEESKGTFKFRLKAKTLNGTLIVNDRGSSLEKTIKKSFHNLSKSLKKKKFRRREYQFSEAV